MDVHSSRRRPRSSRQQPGRTSLILPPPENGPRRFAFWIRRRGFSFQGSPSLVVLDRLGVWSVAHGRYIRQNRLHRYFELRGSLEPFDDTYTALVRDHGMDRWPEFRRAAGEIAALRQRLFDMYWDARPEEMNAAIVRFYEEKRRKARRAKLAVLVSVVAAPAALLAMAALGFVLLRVMLLGRYSGWTSLCLTSAYLAALYLLHAAWQWHASYQPSLA